MATTTSTYFELQSFLWKFAQLSSFGLDAKINFNSCKGSIQVNLSADIGSMLQPPLLTPPECGNFNFRGKPSRVRRRTRQKETREAGNVIYQSEEVLVNDNNNEEQKPHNGNTCASDDTNAACEDFIGPIHSFFFIRMLFFGFSLKFS